MSGKPNSWLKSSQQIWRRRGVTAVAGGTSILCLALLTPVIFGTAGCGSGSDSTTLLGGGVNLGRAAVLLGTFKGTQTLAGGAVQETVIEFAPGTATETLVGSYTLRTLAQRPGGGNAYTDFSSGTVAGNILANGDLNLVFTADDESRARNNGSATRATQSVYQVSQGGAVLQQVLNGIIQQTLQRLNAVIQTYRANSIAGTYSGSPSTVGGFQFFDPRDDSVFTTSPLNQAFTMSVSYNLIGNSVNIYNAAVTLPDPTTGTPYTATGVSRLFTQYDGTFPNYSGITNLGPNEFFVITKGKLPATASPLQIPVGAGTNIPITLANRPFLIEAGSGTYQGKKFQLGTIYLKLDIQNFGTDLLLAGLLKNKYGIDLSQTSGYLPVGHFFIATGATATPTPTPTPTSSPGTPAVGTIQFSNVSSPTNAITTKITDTDASASLTGNILNASLTEKNGHSTTERDLSIQLGATSDDSSLAVGKTFPITSGTVSTGKATVAYIETAGSQKFWFAQGGSVVVTAHDSQHTTLSVVGATMTPFNNAGGATQPTGTFTIDAAGKF